MTYSLTLRDGLLYSNGAPVKASDFKTTIERDFKLDSAGAAFFLNINGAEAFARKPTKRGIGGIEVDNKARTIVIHLKQPQADFSNVLASEFAAPVPADAPATDTSLHPLPATGPYVIKSYQPRSGIVEERNPKFQAWRFHKAVPAGNPDRVTWDIVPDASVALHRVLTGKDDWMSYYPVPSKRLPGIEQKHKSQLRFFTPPNLMYFFMNTQVAPFTSPKVRQAVNYAISRRWLKRLAGGLAGTTENVLPPGYPSFRGHSLYRHDLRKAIRLVHESGYWHWRKKIFVWNHDVPADLPFTEYLVKVLHRLGFRATPKRRHGRQLLDDDRQREDAGADRLRGLRPGLPASARLVPAPRRGDENADPQLELRESRRRLGEPRDREADAVRRSRREGSATVGRRSTGGSCGSPPGRRSSTRRRPTSSARVWNSAATSITSCTSSTTRASVSARNSAY